MKGIGFIGILVIAGGAVMIYSGFTGKPPLEVIAALLRGETPADDPKLPATQGSSGASGFGDANADGLPDGTAGQGAGGGGGGGW